MLGSTRYMVTLLANSHFPEPGRSLGRGRGRKRRREKRKGKVKERENENKKKRKRKKGNEKEKEKRKERKVLTWKEGKSLVSQLKLMPETQDGLLPLTNL